MHYTSREVYEHVSKKLNDPIIERRTCAVSWTEFPIYSSDDAFYAKISPTFDGKKFPIPRPTLCPEERQRRRLMFRNERKLYKRKCDATWESIISMYSPDKPYKVYNQKYRWSDAWDAMEYGREYQSGLWFEKQFIGLLHDVPTFNLYNVDPENAEYVNHTYKAHSSYMCFSSLEPDRCLHSWWIIRSSQCIDCAYIENSENCYECVKCKKCFNVFYSQNSEDCSNSSFLDRCFWCSYCHHCWWLNNKQYCIYNKQYTKEEYFKKTGTLREDYDDDNRILPALDLMNAENSIWNNLSDCNSCVLVCDFANGQWVKYTFDDEGYSNSMDCYGATWWEWQYECMWSANSYMCLWNFYANNNTNVYYSNKIYNCKNCFACVWIRDKEYCILNKQYSKEEYEKVVSLIVTDMIKEWRRGEFFSPDGSMFSYNETIADTYFPRSNVELNNSKVVHDAQNIIDPIGFTDKERADLISMDGIHKKVFLCVVTKTPFLIQDYELQFYKKHNIPLPKKHPDQRHKERFAKRPWRTLYMRKCDATGEETLSIYPLDYHGKIYSLEAYKKIVW